MKRMEMEIRIPDWAAGQLAEKAEDLGVDITELVSSLITHNIATYEPQSGRHFLVTAPMAEEMAGELFMVVARRDGQVVMAPTREIPFEQAAGQFAANGLTEEQILEVHEDLMPPRVIFDNRAILNGMTPVPQRGSIIWHWMQTKAVQAITSDHLVLELTRKLADPTGLFHSWKFQETPFVVSLSNHQWAALRQAQGER